MAPKATSAGTPHAAEGQQLCTPAHVGLPNAQRKVSPGRKQMQHEGHIRAIVQAAQLEIAGGTGEGRDPPKAEVLIDPLA